jgi:hypothetical protein
VGKPKKIKSEGPAQNFSEREWRSTYLSTAVFRVIGALALTGMEPPMLTETEPFGEIGVWSLSLSKQGGLGFRVGGAVKQRQERNKTD